MLGIHTPIGSAFNPVVYLYCLLQTEIKKVSLNVNVNINVNMNVNVIVNVNVNVNLV